MNKAVNFFKKYSNKGIAILCVIAIVFVSIFSMASTASADVLDDSDNSDLETDLNKILTKSILGLDWSEVIAQYFDVFYETISLNYWNVNLTLFPQYGDDNLFGSSYLDECGKKYDGYYVNPPIDWDQFVLYAQERRKSEIDSTSFDDLSYVKKNNVDPVHISGETLKAAAADYNSRYMPLVVQDSYVWSYNSSTTTKQNPKKASDWINSFTFYPTAPVYSNTSTVWGGKGWGGSKEKGVYILPFWVDDDTSYGTCFNKYYIHLYAIAATSDTSAQLCMDLYSLSDNSLAKSYSVDWSSDYPYLGFRYYSAFTIFGYKSNADYYAHTSASQRLRSDANMCVNFYSSDYKLLQFNSMIVSSTFNPDTDKSDDWGYYVQNSPFELFANQTSIDFNRIPDNFIITIKGDTIYDYSITNPDTGDTTDIDDFIKHDYDIPDLEDPDDNGGGGSVSGDITVSGKVDVSGKIEIDTKPIDININVNSGSSSGSSGTLEAGDFIDPGTVDTNLDHYLDKVPELSKGFIDYLKDFFAWLPDEIYGLIILGLVVCIFCRIAGR